MRVAIVPFQRLIVHSMWWAEIGQSITKEMQYWCRCFSLSNSVYSQLKVSKGQPTVAEVVVRAKKWETLSSLGCFVYRGAIKNCDKKLLTPREPLQIRSRREFERFCISACRRDLNFPCALNDFHIPYLPSPLCCVVVRTAIPNTGWCEKGALCDR